MRYKIGWRVAFLAIGMAAFIAAGAAGASTRLTPEEAAQVREEFEAEIGGIDQNGIFVHNALVTLGMFIPGAGAGLGGFSGFTTGVVLVALTEQQSALLGFPPQLILLFLLLTPFGAMEVFVYGLAMSRSGMLVHQLAKKKPKTRTALRQFFDEDAVPTFIEIGIAAAVLFAASIIEWQFIESFGGIEQLGGF